MRAAAARGMQFTSRPGHAIWVGLFNSDIDRPLFIESQYLGVVEGAIAYHGGLR